ncbi:putative lipase domain protein [Trypanosoma rangeli]|uniref:Putative lipase domain protein n=1 Tax=Trypanosoma rangeli TaxID=5698 RepID=A0A422NL04_TRYRA|nr:putative lipase domain protein [Trypanosoma rangeli]RNF06145.1 putative lipase domain protein [Trypanosoma rangeli]|eukprot:RNF06145.1 putative lipase domain protein [Trypanosoma rangeli]
MTNVVGDDLHALSAPLLAHESSSKARREEGVLDVPSVTNVHNNPRGRLVAELQIETLSTTFARIFLYSWYLVLFLALAFQSVVPLQWKMTNICGDTPESLYQLDTWSSPCVQRRMLLSHGVDGPNFAVGGELHAVSMDVLQDFIVGEEATAESLECDAIVNNTRLRRQCNLRWVGNGQGMSLDVKLNRFVRVILSMASPKDQLPEGMEWKRYPLMVALEESPLSPDEETSSSSRMPPPKGVFLYNTSTVCYRASPRCSSVVLPQTVAVATKESQITLTIFDVDEALGNVSAASAVGIFFQRSAYTVSTIVCRYVFLFFSILHLIRFIYRKRYSRTLYEQYWVMFLHLALYLYLDPFFVVGIYATHSTAMYNFLEFRIPTYFAVLLSCFIFALITASINWTVSGRATARFRSLSQHDVRGQSIVPCFPVVASSPPLGTPRPMAGVSSMLTAPLQQQGVPEEEQHLPSRDISRRASFVGSDGVRPMEVLHSATPLWATMSMTNYFLAVLFLDIAQSYFGGWDLGTDMACVSFACLYIRYTLYSLMLIFIVMCCVFLVQLHRSLGRRPYLETRPQQLACRVFIFVFTTALIYFVVQVILIAFLYPQILGIVAYQPFTQLSSVIVSTFFVNYITFVYTTTVASRRVPIRPENPQWRHVRWSREWYRWLNLHGGILYIFHNERQERYFNWLQNSGNTFTKGHGGESDLAGKRECGDAEKQSARECGDANAFAVSFEREGAAYYQTAAAGGEGNDRNFSPESSESESDDICMDLLTESSHSPRIPQSRSGVVEFLEKAERQLIDRPAIFIDHLEEALVDPLQALLFRRRGRMPFFNLETAIDCLNLSWEAYLTTERVEDTVELAEEPDTGLFQRLQRRYFCRGSAFGGETNNNSGDGGEIGEAKQRDRHNCSTHDSNESGRGNYTGTEAPAVSVGEESLPALGMNTEQYGYKQLAVFEVRDVRVVITVMDTTLSCHHRKLPRLVIAFRGTDNFSNAREDLRFRQRIWREVDTLRNWGLKQRAKVHTGFLTMWLSLKEGVLRTIKSYLSEHREKVCSMFCTGHSLGGALACLCAYSLQRMLRLMAYPLLEVTVYTYGQPPIGNKAFQTAYNKAVPRTFRVVNESDVVSFLTLFGGCHVGIEVDIDRHGNYICKPMFIERWFRPTQGRGFAVANHTLASYAQSLNAVATRNGGDSCKLRCLEPYVSATEVVSGATSPELAHSSSVVRVEQSPLVA